MQCTPGHRPPVREVRLLHAGRGGGGGEYTVQLGFGWTNGALLDIMETIDLGLQDIGYEP